MTNDERYEGRFWSRPLARRGLLQGAAAGGLGLAAAALVGCGDDDDDDDDDGAPVGGTQPAGTTVAGEAGAPIRGGTLTQLLYSEPNNLDPRRTTHGASMIVASHAYSRLFKYATGPGIVAEDYTPVPDLVETFESPDPANFTFTLRENVKMQDVPPLNGRPLIAEDIVYAYEQFVGSPTNPAKDDLNMVDSVTAIDNSTVQFKLKFEYVPFIGLLASPRDLWIVPRELDETPESGGGDAQKNLAGSGPFILEKHEPSERFSWRRNPEYFAKGADGKSLPYVDFLEDLIITDSNVQLAQFAAGRLDTVGVPATRLDEFRSTNPDATLQSYLGVCYSRLHFPANTFVDDRPPFNDVRVRRAISLALDRPVLLQSLANGEGAFDNSPIPNGMAYWWLDPFGKEMGEAGKWYQHDVPQAKQLLSAAGHPDGFEVPIHFGAGSARSQQQAEAYATLLNEVGIQLKLSAQDYVNWIIPNVYGGKFEEGIANQCIIFFDPDAMIFHAFMPDGAWGPTKVVGDSKLESLFAAQRRETDLERRRDIIHDVQRHTSDQMYNVPTFESRSFIGIQPWVHNFHHNASSTPYGIGSEVRLFAWTSKDT